MDPKKFLFSSTGKPILTPKGYWAFVPNPLPPEIAWDAALSTALSNANVALTTLNTISFALPLTPYLVKSFVRQEAVLSSRIEGTRTTLEGLYRYEARQLGFFEHAPDAKEVHNYVRALEHGQERLETLPLSLRFIRELHHILMEDVRGQEWQPGEFRTSQNWVGPPGSTIETAPYVPPPVDEMHETLHEMENFLHVPSDLPALVRAALVHYQFEAIHPFLDGNGRVGRLLILLLLIEWKIINQPLIYLSGYFEANRQRYYDLLLAISQTGDVKTWLLYFLEGIQTQAMRAHEVIDGLQAIRAAYQEKLHTDRAKERILQVVDALLGQPIATIQQLKEATGLPDRTVRRYVSRLIELGLLQETTGFDRNRIFEAKAVIQVLQNN